MGEADASSVLALMAYIATAATTDFKPPHAILGSWTFMPEHSAFEPGPAPYQRMTLNFSVTENGLRNDADGVDGQRRPIHASYLIVTDGNDHPVTGMRAFDSSSYTRVSESTTVYVRQKRGRRSLSAAVCCRAMKDPNFQGKESGRFRETTRKSLPGV
mgnify:FL=1